MVCEALGKGGETKTMEEKKITSFAGQKFAVGQELMIIIFNIRKASFRGVLSLYKCS